MFLSLIASAACAINSAASILDANRAATLLSTASASDTMTLRYAYSGQGLTGTIDSTINLSTGSFVDEDHIGPTRDASGFDGKRAWMKDLSGAFTPQAGGDKPALAINKAYRNANLWWHADRGGAKIESSGCGALRVSPLNGKPFETWFDPATHLLTRVREAQSFGATTDTLYSNFKSRSGRMVATTVDIDTVDEPTNRQTLRLTRLVLSAKRPAVSYTMPDTKPADWTLPSSGRVTLPFRLVNNHVVIDVRVDSRGPFPFIVDTGGHDILTPATIEALGIRSKGSATASGAGEATAASGYVHVARLDVEGAVLTNQTLVTLDFSPLSVEGLQIGGIIGVEFFERFIIQLDYGSKTMTIIDPNRFSMAERNVAGAAIPFSFYEHIPQVQGFFENRSARFNIDTGSRVEVTLTSPFVSGAHLRESYPTGIAVTDGWGVGGASRSYVVRAGSLTLGTVTVRRPVASLSLARHGAFSDASYEGNVGSGLLKRFIVTFDYERRMMYLKRLVNFDADTGRFDRFGLWLNLGNGGLQVMDVAKGSPAAMAGLRVGDLITAIGGEPIAGRDLSEIRSELRLAPVQRPLSIVYERQDVRGNATIYPRDLIPD